MKKSEFRDTYDAVIGLGSNCQVTYQLKRLGLQTKYYPIDNMIFENISSLCKAIDNHFEDFCMINNLEYRNLGNAEYHYVIYDKQYDCYYYHDFTSKLPQERWYLAYKTVKESKMRRIERFYDSLNNSKAILIVRASSDKEDVTPLLEVISNLSSSVIHILSIRYSNKFSINNNQTENICYATIPENPDKWEGYDEYWNKLLGNIKLSNIHKAYN